MREVFVFSSLFLLSCVACALSPVKHTLEQEVCNSEYVFIGRVIEVRPIRTRQYCMEPERPKFPSANGEEGLRMDCEAYEAGIGIEEVISPAAWKPSFTEVTFRFYWPGSQVWVSRQLTGSRRIFLATHFVDGNYRKLKPTFFELSFGKDLAESDRVRALVANTCQPRPVPIIIN